MRKIRLAIDIVLPTNCVVSVYDATQGIEKRRCKITVEYARTDIRKLKSQGRGETSESALEYYREWIYGLIKHYIPGDWECVVGFEEVMATVEEYIKQYY
ncbi:MAG: hypothetical protein GX663_01405 [Clostridiales bacterium]|nr:hypothetical protein [Clostridiales bacterium]